MRLAPALLLPVVIVLTTLLFRPSTTPSLDAVPTVLPALEPVAPPQSLEITPPLPTIEAPPTAAAIPTSEPIGHPAGLDEAAGSSAAPPPAAPPPAAEPPAIAAPPAADTVAAAPTESCDLPLPPPLPAPGSPGTSSIWQSIREPLPPAPLWNPTGRKRVGLQAGHWRVEEVPTELRALGHGAVGGGKTEWEVNLDIAQRTAALLEQAGVDVDVLPATVPVRYRAHVFVSLHSDGDESGRLRGYKLARPSFSATPGADDHLLETLYESYGEATGLPRDANISRRMTAYYAFNSRRYCHAVAPGVPSAIVELGFLTSTVDRQLLIGNPDAAARGLARGLLRYLELSE